MVSKQEDVFLAPCDPANFDRTVRSPVDLNGSQNHPDALDGLDEVRFWGARVGSQNRTYFEKMSPDDLVLFYRDGRYVGPARIGTTFEDGKKWASANFWRNAPSQLVYTLDSFTPISVEKSAVNRIFDYAETYNPQGLTRVAPDRVTRTTKAIELAVERYGSEA